MGGHIAAEKDSRQPANEGSIERCGASPAFINLVTWLGRSLFNSAQSVKGSSGIGDREMLSDPLKSHTAMGWLRATTAAEVTSPRSQLRDPHHTLVFESNSDEVEFPPYEVAFAGRPEIIERNFEGYRYKVDAIQVDARAAVGDIADAARMYPCLTRKKHQRVPIDESTADRPPLNRLSMKNFLKVRHCEQPQVKITPPSGT